MERLYNIRIMYKDGSISGFLADTWLIDTERQILTAERGPNSYDNGTQLSSSLTEIGTIYVDDARLYNYTEHEKGEQCKDN